MFDILKESNIGQPLSYLAKTTNSRESKEDKVKVKKWQVSKEEGILSYK